MTASLKVEEPLYSIGELAERTGINPDTIRVWERRYGRPVPQRLPSGHRRYGETELRHLRRVAEAMARGHRPSKLLNLEPHELDAILAEQGRPSSNKTSIEFQSLLQSIRHFRREALRTELLERYESASDPLDYLDEVLAPIIEMVGRQWADGDLAVRHEHFLSETVEDVLRTLRVMIEEKRGATADDVPMIVLATLPGERHDLGLQMVALTSTLCGMRVHGLGVETPLVEIEETMRETKACTVGISVSLATGGIHADRQIRRLRATLPIDTSVIAGGAGARRARRGVQGVLYFKDLHELSKHLEKVLAKQR